MVSRRTVNVHYINGIKELIEEGIVPFIQQHEDLYFYAIYFDISLLTGEITVSLNTEFDYQRRKQYYLVNNIHSKLDLRYLVTEWNYQCIASVTPIDEDTFDSVYTKKPETFAKMCVQTIHEYMNNLLPHFKGEIIVHVGDETIENSINRFKKYCLEIK